MSKQRRGGLGRGLGALIPTAAPASEPPPAESAPLPSSASAAPEPEADLPDGAAPQDPDGTSAGHASAEERPAAEALTPVPGATFAELPISEIKPNPRQPRQVFDEEALAELAHSIREFGVLQPVVVRALPSGGGWELVMGERRLRAAAAAGLDTIPAIVRSTSDDAMLRDALLENVHRTQLNPLEEAAAYQQLLEEFGATHDELAQRLGRSRPQVTNTVRLLNLSLPVQRRVAAGVLSAGHARALLSLDDPEQQDELAARIVAEGLSVRATEELVALARRGEDIAARKRRARPPRISAPALGDLAERLSDVLDTRVRVDIGRRKGRITVEFASIDDLERIVAVMAPAVAGQTSPPVGQPGPSVTDTPAAGNEPKWTT
jgi:ParB family chromosome partitioning protein